MGSPVAKRRDLGEPSPEPHIHLLKDPNGVIPQDNGVRAQRGTERSGVSFSSPKIILPP
ncbi:MAG: hypothetical protein J7K81_00005 [Methanophagales archaeon]|nr:hypothetical protein [Methanophagales archaeon]